MRQRLSAETQQLIIQLYQEGMGSDTIGKQLEIHPTAILKVLKRNGIERRPFKRKIEITEFPKIVQMYEDGLSSPKIADKYSVSHSIILKILEKEGCERRDADDTHRIHAIKEDYFDNIDTAEKSHILGYFYADGCNHQEANYISFDAETGDIDLLQKISERIYLDKPHDKVRSYERTRLSKKGEWKIYYSSVLSVNSKHICQTLFNLGCEPRKSLTAQFPKWLNDSTLRRHFIRGYFDGDGGTYIPNFVGRGAQCTIIGTTEFVETTASIIKDQVGINLYISVLDKGLRRIYVNGNQQCKSFLDWLYQDSTIHLDRKYTLYQELLTKMDANSRTRKSP